MKIICPHELCYLIIRLRFKILNIKFELEMSIKN